MTLIAGASQYYNQSLLVQTTGSNVSTTNVLSESVSSSLLDAGRGNAVQGIGLSARARAMTTAMLNTSASTANQMFSLSGGASATVEAAQIQIAGLRATANMSRDVTIQDDGSFSSSRIGLTVDEEV